MTAMPPSHADARLVRDALLAIDRPLVLIGLMGAGKSSIGRRLARWLGLPFVDADAEIEAAANMTIEEIFTRYGESHFRYGERRVVERLLDGGPKVLATGGGAFMDAGTRALIKARGRSIWLKADMTILIERTSRRNTRPLLKTGEPEEILKILAAERYPVYAEADMTIATAHGSQESVVRKILEEICARGSRAE